MKVLGILLSVYSSRGHQLVFQYPPQDDVDPAYKWLLPDLEPPFLADLLSPKAQLCDKKFQLTIDKVTFVGVPSLLAENQFERAAFLREAAPTSEEIKMLHYADLVTTVKSAGQILRENRLNNSLSSVGSVHSSMLSASANAKQSSNMDEAARQSWTEGEKDFRTQKRPSLTSDSALKNPGSTNSTRGMGGNSVATEFDSFTTKGSSGLGMFHVAFMVVPLNEFSDVDEFSNFLYDRVLCRLAAALNYEQKRRNYVRNECRLIASLGEERGFEPSELCSGCSPHSAFVDYVISKSSLAKLLTDVYGSVATGQAGHFVINDFLFVDCCAVAPPRCPALEHGTSIPPFKTLLLHQDPDQLIAILPKGTNPLLLSVVRVATPTRSLKEICNILEIAFPTLVELVLHLLAWNYATVIHRIHSRDLYLVHPSIDYRRIEPLEREFRSKFPLVANAGTLSSLVYAWRKAAPLGTVAPTLSDRQQRVKFASWMLRQQLICQMRLYVHIRLVNSESAGNVAGVVAHPEKTSGPDYDAVCQIAATAADFTIRALFLRLAPYMNGQSSIETMEFSTKISRRDIKRVITSFDPYLVTLLSPTKPN